MKKTSHWPKKGDKLFKGKSIDVSSPTLAAVKWLKRLHVDDSWLADAFKECADKIIRDLKRGRSPRHADIYFIPIGYLYRHSLELRLKQIVRLALKLDLLEENEKITETLKNHNLYPLWNYAKSSLVKFWPDGPVDDLIGVEHIVQSFHNIDKSGQNLRYVESSHGQSTISKMPEYVDLIHFKNVFTGVFNLLSGCEDAFGDAFQTECEVAQEL